MLFNTKLEIGSHKARSLMRVSATNAGFAIFIVLRGVLNRRLTDILKLVYLTVKDVASVT